MLTILSYIGILVGFLSFTLVLYFGLTKIQLI